MLHRRVFPLLAEYFYDDRERLAQVLGAYSAASGSGFVEAAPAAGTAWAGAAQDDGWTLHDYPAGELGEALWRTFAGAA